MSYSARFIFRGYQGDQEVFRAENGFNARALFSPRTVHLRAGETARTQLIASPLPAQGTPLQSFLVIATNKPGVRYSLGTVPGYESYRSGAWASPSDGVHSELGPAAAGDITRWEQSKWQDNQGGTSAPYAKVHAVQVDPDQVSDGTYTLKSTIEAGELQTSFVHIYGSGLASVAYPLAGTGAYRSLGNDEAGDDGKIFQFWIKPPDGGVPTLDEVKLTFESYPYASDENDGDTVDGAMDDTDLTSNLPVNDYWSVDVTTQCLKDTWRLVRVKKSDFTATGNPLWSRITRMVLRVTYSDAPDNKDVLLGPIYYGHPPNSEVNSIALVPFKATTRTGLFVNLDAPATTDADVTLLAIIH